jgi:hypothetical protein
MIKDRQQFEQSIRAVAKMYGLRDLDLAEPLYSESLRQDAADSVVGMIRKIEREIAQYIASHAEEFGLETPAPAVAKAA